MLCRRMITVLVIDPDPVVRLAARRVLEPAGVILIAIANVSTALARLAVVRVDLVIYDIDALAPDGMPAINAVSDIDASAQMLALFPKQRDTTFTRTYVGNALGKPFTPSELLTKVRRALVGRPSEVDLPPILTL
jgi:DNA-binding NtrC family response regulator